MAPSVGSAPSISRAGAGAWVTPSSHRRQAYFGPHRDDHPKLCRHDVEPLGTVLADLHHLPAAAGAQRALRLDHLFDPGQVFRQMAEIARRTRPLPRCERGRRGVFWRRRGLHLRRRALKLLERQLALVRRQLLRPLAIQKPDQFQVQMFQTADALGLRLVLGAKRLQLPQAPASRPLPVRGSACPRSISASASHGSRSIAQCRGATGPDQPAESFRLSRGPNRQRPHTTPVQAREQAPRTAHGSVSSPPSRIAGHTKPCSSRRL